MTSQYSVQHQLLLVELNALGLAFRLDGVSLTSSQCEVLCCDAFKISRNVRYDAPDDTSGWIHVVELRGEPDAGGWITRAEKADSPFWILKRELHLLTALEYALDDISLLTKG